VDPGLLTAPFTLAEAKTAIAGMNKNSAMGPDSDSPHYSPCEEAWRHHPRRPETNIPSKSVGQTTNQDDDSATTERDYKIVALDLTCLF